MALKQGIKGSIDMENLFDTEYPNFSGVLSVLVQNFENIILRITEFMVNYETFQVFEIFKIFS